MTSGLWQTRRGVTALVFGAATLSGGCNPIFGIHEGKPRPICADPSGNLIDDMEDGDGFICEMNGRQGHWYVVGDSTSTILGPGDGTSLEPSLIDDQESGTSRYAAHFTGSGFTQWGALMGFNLKVEGLSVKTYDASALGGGGIKFRMKSNTPVSVDFPIPDTTERRFGGHCEDSASASNCDNDFSFKIAAPTPDWTEYEVPFLALAQDGGFANWDPHVLIGIKFRVPAGAPFDVWVDDIRFYPCSTGSCRPTCTDPTRAASCPAIGRYPAGCRPTGTDCLVVTNWCADAQLIDDLEDDDNTICISGGRYGTWFVTDDGTSTNLTPASGSFAPTEIRDPRGTSRYAARLTGSGFTGWGALIGVDLNVQRPNRLSYDASGADGISFLMKSNARVAVSFALPETTTPDGYGGTCNVEVNCDNHFYLAVDPSQDQWVQYKVPFAALRQDVLHDTNDNLIAGSARWDPSLITSIYFSASGDFDFWIDDIRFYSCRPNDCLPTCAGNQVACPKMGGQPAGCWPAGTDCATTPFFVVNTAVWGSGPDDVWVVGASTATVGGVIRHWDGNRWTSASGDVSPPIWSVWGSASGDVWAVGDHGTVVRQNGLISSATASGTSARLTSVWGTDPKNIWTVAYPGKMRHWDGTAWSDSPGGTSDFLWNVWGSGSGDVWAVGAKETAIHWDGSSWSPRATGTSHNLYGVWGNAPENFWAVGDGGAVTFWNGSIWAEGKSDTTSTLVGIWGSDPNNVWAVGLQGAIVHWDGTAWSSVSSGTTYDLYSVWGTAPDDVWAVGTGTILHWDGARWSPR